MCTVVGTRLSGLTSIREPQEGVFGVRVDIRWKTDVSIGKGTGVEDGWDGDTEEVFRVHPVHDGTDTGW